MPLWYFRTSDQNLKVGYYPDETKSILLKIKIFHCWWRLFFLNMSNTAVVTWCAYIVFITFTAFSKHIPAANEFTIPASLSDSGRPYPNMRSPRVLYRAISVWSTPRRRPTTNRSSPRNSGKVHWFFCCQIVKRLTLSWLEFVRDLNLLLFSLSTPYYAVSSLVLQLSHERGAKCRDQTKSNFDWAKLMVISLLR